MTPMGDNGGGAGDDATLSAPGAAATSAQQLVCVCMLEVPGGAGYIQTVSVSPSGTVVAFGFESGAIIVAVCGARRVAPGGADDSAAGRLVLPQLLVVARTVARVPRAAPRQLLIDERRASVLSVDADGTLEVLLFPADLRLASGTLCSSAQRLAAAQRRGDPSEPEERPLPPMRAPACVGVRLFPVDPAAAAAAVPDASVAVLYAGVSGPSGGGGLLSPSGAALRLCSELEAMQLRALRMLAARREADAAGAPNMRRAATTDLDSAFRLMAARVARASCAPRVDIGARNTAAASALDTHFLHGDFAPQFNPYTCVASRDPAQSALVGGRLLTDAAELLSVVESARAQAFARSAPSLAPSTVAAKFRALRALVAKRIRTFRLSQLSLSGSGGGGSRTFAAADSAGAPASAAQPRASSSPTAAVAPWRAVASERPRLAHELVAVDADSIHRGRELLALARFLVPDVATERFCSRYAVAP